MYRRKWRCRAAVLVLLILLVLTGCGSDSQPTQTEEMISIVFCHNQPVGSPEDVGAQAMVEKLKKDRKSNVKYQLALNPTNIV